MELQTTNRWKFIAGNIPLEFINTASGRVWQDEKNPLDYKILKDKLESFSDLVDWGHNIGILTDSSVKRLSHFAAHNEQSALKILRRAVVLRETIYRILISLVEGYKPQQEDIDLLNKECTAAREHQRLLFENNKFKWNFESGNNEQESIIWYIALSASELLTSDQLHRVKQCPGENCGWLFYDTSKNGSRQWCDMRDCGNVAKVRRFRGKKK